MSALMDQYLTAVIEVNSPQAQIGDVISYTITLTNHSKFTITDVVINQSIDRGLEVEANSIGINEVVSNQQSFVDLELPDLKSGKNHTIVFNAVIVGKPQSWDNKIRMMANISYNYQGKRYEINSTTALTKIVITGPSLWMPYSLLTCWKYSDKMNISVSNIQVLPKFYGNICDEWIVQFTVNHMDANGGEDFIRQCIEIQYPYTQETSVSVWAEPLEPTCEWEDLMLMIYIELVG